MMETSEAHANWLSLLPIILLLGVLALLVWIVSIARSTKRQESDNSKPGPRVWIWILLGIGLSLLASIAVVVLTILFGRSANSAAIAPFVPSLFALSFIGWRRMTRMAPESADPAVSASRPNILIWLLIIVGLSLFLWLASMSFLYVFYLIPPALILLAWYCAKRQWREDAYLAVGSVIAFPAVGIFLMMAMNVLSMYSGSYR
ncbi:hypothetical protein [Collimonas pratensis]|uniref:hypothetical protein n=1 Tax=Collimonas pratensis TaxID=279113 RepID=UPI00078302C0|nr:hypothetical protein [Collimonas pratensis]